MTPPRPILLHVNGTDHAVAADPATPLLHLLRNDLGLNGPKYGCGYGECGACAVLVDGKAVRACVIPAGRAEGHVIVTLEGLASPDGTLHPVQQAFVDAQGAQCGYCLNGMIITLTALAAERPDADEAAIRQALRHNLCRCGTHLEILDAARLALAMAATAAAPPEPAS
ncbi:(2Fe-2S)-binding protein [Methylobrevis albus]|uniref:(2Fe-2S)-binding protein n=1 Tax=Methylobrevis albus TaxID=2793297 RepID=A0A931MZL2_9HYPH|nr:(2Fe-2S)-binding protein [Methylobrevis albus]MBH0239140.1 (2Fe-2S)-binding protein [Methylobrevis albus]